MHSQHCLFFTSLYMVTLKSVLILFLIANLGWFSVSSYLNTVLFYNVDMEVLLLLCVSTSLAPLLPVMYKTAEVWSKLMEILSYSQMDVGLVL